MTGDCSRIRVIRKGRIISMKNRSRFLTFGKIAALLLLLSLLFAAGRIQSVSAETQPAQQGDRIWYDVDEQSIESKGERRIVPDTYRTLTIDYDALVNQLEQAPMEFTPESFTTNTVMAIPLPNGVNERFNIFESPVMAPELAEKFPEITTYYAVGVDDPYASGRLDLTPFGFHAMIFSSSGTFYIDPFSTGDPLHYVSYFKTDYSAPEDVVYEELGPIGEPEPFTPPTELITGENLRTHRLAQATTGEYSQFHGGTVPLVMAEVVTAINRVTGIYEREVAIRLELIANNDQLIYLDAANDPYTNNNGGLMLGENQANIDAVIGNANYDIGHVFSTGGGGIARLNAVCGTGIKARGVTGLTSPVGDPFYVDYVAHEMGHQYGGNHTFNGIAGSCAGNRAANAAYEPGSATTIMGYAGICAEDNTQSNSDDYFHTKNYDEMVAFTTTGGGSTCGVVTATGNHAPVVDAGTGGFNIPINTPFTLNGSATDSDSDPLTYNWEEFDLGPAGHPNTPVGNAPIFRSFTAVTETHRTFPQMSDVVNNTQTIGEILPSYARDLTFRLTARDNHSNPSAGGVAYDTIAFDVTDQAGPFLVTSPNTAVTWAIGSLQPVAWDVANTDMAPVSCPVVKISLSTDGGYTYPETLAASTPNDGTHYVPVPNTPTSTARVQVSCPSNIFFDISNVNFSIADLSPYASLAATKSVDPSTNLDPGDALTYTIDVLNTGTLLATVTTEDDFDSNLLTPFCNGVPGDLSDLRVLSAASGTMFECTAQVDPGLSIEIDKVVDNPEVAAGTSVTYTITVTNPNTLATVENVVVTDPDVSGCTPNLGTPIQLAPLANQVYVCPDVPITGDVTNVAVVTAEYHISNSATASAPEASNSPVTSNIVESIVLMTDSDSATVTVPTFYSFMPLLVGGTDPVAPPRAAAPIMGFSLAITGLGIVFSLRKRQQ